MGYAIIDWMRSHRPPYRYVECGVIRARPKDSVPERLHMLANVLGEVIAEFLPDVLALEKAYHGSNAASALKLGQARGAIMLLGTQNGLAVFEYAPSHIKRAVTGHGRATKVEVQNRVALLCGLRKLPDVDAADALAIALCHGQSAPRKVVASTSAVP